MPRPSARIRRFLSLGIQTSASRWIQLPDRNGAPKGYGLLLEFLIDIDIRLKSEPNEIPLDEWAVLNFSSCAQFIGKHSPFPLTLVGVEFGCVVLQFACDFTRIETSDRYLLTATEAETLLRSYFGPKSPVWQKARERYRIADFAFSRYNSPSCDTPSSSAKPMIRSKQIAR